MIGKSLRTRPFQCNPERQEKEGRWEKEEKIWERRLKREEIQKSIIGGKKMRKQVNEEEDIWGNRDNNRKKIAKEEYIWGDKEDNMKKKIKKGKINEAMRKKYVMKRWRRKISGRIEKEEDKWGNEEYEEYEEEILRRL